MYCKKCGAKNKDGARFCAKCGQELTQKSQVQKKPEQEPVVQKRVSPKSIIQNEHIQPKSEIHKQEVHQNRVQNEKPPKKKSIGKAILKILIFIAINVVRSLLYYLQQKTVLLYLVHCMLIQNMHRKKCCRQCVRH